MADSWTDRQEQWQTHGQSQTVNRRGCAKGEGTSVSCTTTHGPRWQSGTVVERRARPMDAINGNAMAAMPSYGRRNQWQCNATAKIDGRQANATSSRSPKALQEVEEEVEEEVEGRHGINLAAPRSRRRSQEDMGTRANEAPSAPPMRCRAAHGALRTHRRRTYRTAARPRHHCLRNGELICCFSRPF
ncbi:hypothetical protein EKO04_007501 [Ascochyta lentis]|uniref:Uncharacterized protein n=1 Tax=Ascochyta lentis TaxID=205686 RepID=A0A8H7J073_9PLEO|nr:hypothetical protein EKO04_007501 [Ascochyta lentis]